MWKVDHIPADFTAVVGALGEDITCVESKKLISEGKSILRQLKRKKRMPGPNTMDRWKKALKFEKKICKR